MYSRHHLIASTAIAGGFALTTNDGLLIILYGALVGTLIDLDHFPIARYNRGDWQPLYFCLSHPRHAIFDQSEIFDETDVFDSQRLFTHAILGGVLVAITIPFHTGLGLVTAVIIYGHIVMDLIADLTHNHHQVAETL